MKASALQAAARSLGLEASGDFSQFGLSQFTVGRVVVGCRASGE